MTGFRWHYGPTGTDPDPGKRWHEACGGEVWTFNDRDVCVRCSAGHDMSCKTNEGNPPMTTNDYPNLTVVDPDERQPAPVRLDVDWDTVPRMLQELCDGHPGYSVEVYRLDFPDGAPMWLCQRCWMREWREAGMPKQKGTR